MEASRRTEKLQLNTLFGKNILLQVGLVPCHALTSHAMPGFARACCVPKLCVVLCHVIYFVLVSCLVPTSWYQSVGNYQVPDTRILAPGSCYIPKSWYQGFGAKPQAWYQDLGIRILVLCSCCQNLGTSILVHRPWYQDLGAKISVARSCYQDHCTNMFGVGKFRAMPCHNPPCPRVRAMSRPP